MDQENEHYIGAGDPDIDIPFRRPDEQPTPFTIDQFRIGQPDGSTKTLPGRYMTADERQEIVVFENFLAHRDAFPEQEDPNHP